ncbi:PREDICTED: putative disease resistance protein At4g19050 [Prunus mume]|uniref:Disease resistance protein At4g19050 n=1 Tax=Prunus mume TaxID=102107 RepID=A0ABM0PKI4_PRUMU|nr:PREDICTED: putative disease resistance protein At4g19050 [Prunus mume]XP_008240921.1 PREDICTED: putative disease resistance protein At4g19050 [Prunus mume]XP_008240922.1 PREDICTED: putative disease resistance protein At4g19050 [Prunus mume]XP_016651887.1 PREDICTED: putative disease resistance protein At4g19050 [Prunus mume]
MASGTEERIKKILESLKKDDVTTVVLDGKRGVGKTWTAREISMQKDSIFHDSLWLYLNNKYDSKSLHENLARQMSLFSIHEECEDDDVEEEEKEILENLKLKISKKLQDVISAARKNNKLFLLILDDVPHEQDAEEIMTELKKLLNPNDISCLKVLITRDQSDGKLTAKGRNEEIRTSNTRLCNIYVDQLSTEESKILLKEKVKKEISDSPSFEILSNFIVERRKSMPNEIITIAKALNYIGHIDSGVWSLDSVFEAAANDAEVAINLLFRSWYDTLLSDVTINCFWHSVQLFCKHVGVHYNELITHWIMEGYVGCIDHIEKAYEKGHDDLMKLIDRGMLRKQEDNMVIMGGMVSSITDQRRREFNGTANLGLANVFEDDKWEGLGRLAHADGMIKSPCSPKTWEKVLTLLMDGRSLGREVPERYFRPLQKLQVFTIFNPRFKSLPLSLTSIKSLSILVLRCCDLLEKIDHIRELENLNVLEISGATCLKFIPNNLFAKMPHLRSLNLSESKVTSLPSSLFDKSELRWLILRGCAQLETLPSLKSFKNLKVLDLSGALSFQKFQDKTFNPLVKLQTIDLSNSQINRLPFLHNLGGLTRLLLGGCAHLTRLPTLNTLPRLQILDLSGATGLKEMQNEPLDGLNVLDLSSTQISSIPSSTSNLSDLYLRDCSKLVKLPVIKAMKKLELLNLSGSSNLAEIEDKSLEDMRFLRVLNFSKVKVKALPSLSNLVNLRQLLLMDCSCLEKLPEMAGLKRLQELNLSGCVALVGLPDLKAFDKLEILDASGCRDLKEIQDKSFENMSHIQTLNLSDTRIEFLPSVPKASNLRHLVLRNCQNLKDLPPLDHLSKLEELNLCGAINLNGIKAEFLEQMVHLRILDLSGTPLTKLPSMSRLTNLRQLSLKGCSSLETVPNLEAITLLEILDLSGTSIGSLPPLNIFSNLCQLLLKDCSRIKELQNLSSLRCLEVLNLSGTRIEKFPYEISQLTDLKHLDLPDLKSMHAIDLGKIKRIPQEVNCDKGGIFECADIGGDKPSISVSGSTIFQFLDENPQLWETKFKRFHFSVIEKQGEDGDINGCKDELFFRDLYSYTRHFPKEHDRSLEIHGSYSLPKGFESVLQHADYTSLVDNDRISCLSEIGADNVKVMKGCWIERCSEMKSILHGEEADVRLGSSLEILWISNLPKLSSLYNGKEDLECFKNLKHLYLDCCPMIVSAFPSSQLLENLEIFHVQFCERLTTLFESDSPSGSTLKKLRTLYLLELPELTRIGIKLQAQVTLEVMECPKLSKDHLDVDDRFSK